MVINTVTKRLVLWDRRSLMVAKTGLCIIDHFLHQGYDERKGDLHLGSGQELWNKQEVLFEAATKHNSPYTEHERWSAVWNVLVKLLRVYATMFSSHSVTSKQASLLQGSLLYFCSRETNMFLCQQAGAAAGRHVKSYMLSMKLCTLPQQLNQTCLQHAVAACPAQTFAGK